MTRQKAFQTAAARRRANPIEWVIDDVTVRLKPSADLVSIADLIDELQADPPEGMSDILVADQKRNTMIGILRAFILEGDLESFTKVEPDLDFAILMEMVTDLIKEYSGQENPTQPSSSLNGSPETGLSSTDGAPQEESTQQN
jgi:hypothetical protein